MIRTTVLIGAALCCAALMTTAQVVKVKGKGEIVYQGSKPLPIEEQAAITEAKKNAITRFTADFDSDRFALYKRIEPAVLANLDQYVTDYTQLDQEIDKPSKRYMVIIEASINTALIENAIQKSSGPAVQPVASTTPAEVNYMTFLFVAREVISSQAFDTRQNTVLQTESSEHGKEANPISEDGQSAEHSLDKSTVAETSTGGSTVTRANELTYRVETVTAVDNAVNSVLTKAGYETVDPVDAGLDVEAFKRDFGGGDDISPATHTAAMKTLKEQHIIRYFALANMDVDLATKDGVSGLSQVIVTVTATITDLTPIPHKIASIAGKPYAELGQDDLVAKQNALNVAATRSASELLDQLRMKGIK
jgi:hypothetical protein